MFSVKYTFTLFPSEQHQVPSPKNNHHHNINCVGSTSTAVETYIFVLWMDDNTIAHKESFEHYTTLGMGFLLFVLDILNESSWDMGVSLLYANRTNSDFTENTHESFQHFSEMFPGTTPAVAATLSLITHIIIFETGSPAHVHYPASSLWVWAFDFSQKFIKFSLWWWSSLGQFSLPGGFTWRHFVSRPFVRHVHII